MRDPLPSIKPNIMEDENVKTMTEWVNALKILSGKNQLFFELSAADFMEKLSGLLQSLDHDWVDKSKDLQKTFSYFIINSKYTKAEMQFVTTTTMEWLSATVNIVQYADFIRNLNYVLEEVMQELKEEEKVSIPNNQTHEPLQSV